MEEQLQRLVATFDSEESSSCVATECLRFLKRHGGRERLIHARLCSGMLTRAGGGNTDMRNVLHFAGPAAMLSVIYDNIMHTK